MEGMFYFEHSLKVPQGASSESCFWVISLQTIHWGELKYLTCDSWGESLSWFISRNKNQFSPSNWTDISKPEHLTFLLQPTYHDSTVYIYISDFLIINQLIWLCICMYLYMYINIYVRARLKRFHFASRPSESAWPRVSMRPVTEPVGSWIA